jgi:hypothetical protein
VEIDLKQDVSLRIGDIASIKGEKLLVNFVGTLADSRCPTGVVCVWEGRVDCLVEITYRGLLHRVILSEPGSTRRYAKKPFKEYKIRFHVEPYPQFGTKITPEEYRLTLRITKVTMGIEGNLCNYMSK